MAGGGPRGDDQSQLVLQRQEGGEHRGGGRVPEVEDEGDEGRKPKRAGRPASSGAAKEASAGSQTRRSGAGDRELVLDRVEDGIDDLIIELKHLGGMDQALESLRQVRRAVVRSHEG